MQELSLQLCGTLLCKWTSEWQVYFRDRGTGRIDRGVILAQRRQAQTSRGR